MAELKTKVNNRSVTAFLKKTGDDSQREEAFRLLELMEKTSKLQPKMWGESIIGFGSYHYKYRSGCEGDWFLTGFSPRKRYIAIYLTYGFEELESLMKSLGKFKAGRACISVKRLEDIHLPTLRKIIRLTVKHKRDTENCCA